MEELLITLTVIGTFVVFPIWLYMDSQSMHGPGNPTGRWVSGAGKAQPAKFEMLDRPIQMDDEVVNIRTDWRNPTISRVVWIDGPITRVRPLHARAHQRRDQQTANLRAIRWIT